MSRLPPAGGVLRVDKPEGPTSHDMVGRARRLLGTRRVGHTGTLDPFASGLLLLCVGPATRLSEYLTGLDKEYVATARLGVGTDTLDREGTVLARDEAWRSLGEEDVADAVASLVGTGLQRPPVFSAKKVRGEPAHRRARRGETVELAPVTVTVHDARVVEWSPPDLTFRVTCSSGTYVRALARDLGTRLDTAAHLTGLRRMAVGAFGVEDALALEEVEQEAAIEALVPPEVALAHLPRVDVDEDEARRMAQGQRIPAPEELAAASASPGGGEGEVGPVIVVAGGRLVAVAQARGGELQPRKVFS